MQFARSTSRGVLYDEEQELAWTRFGSSWIATLRGDLPTAEASARETSEGLFDLGTGLGRALGLTACARVDALAGRPEQARRDATAALAILTDAGWHVAAQWPMALLGFVELSAGDPTAAAEVLAPLTAEAITTGMPEPVAHGVLFAGDAAEAAIERALAAHDRVPLPLERARTLLALGRIRRRTLASG
jgi:hypothetical protein